ncbi:centrosomal protein of 112 kDa-like [Physella acuta]|uniref:centrosomal protein of 112 kDa-like n=1 Tax=Physella acuta TaxID=109671 RepID=UPI0027DC4D5F|nr:centrosomal protein of 112 kDa-like [Physella acuta]
METESEVNFKLDREFDKHLADMKPFVLKLPYKTERQKSAVWIKKLCEPLSAGSSGRKTRNQYAQLMLQMLKKGSLQSPFDQKPEQGPLRPLPSYMAETLPDWVEGELSDTVGSSIFHKSTGHPAATSTWVSSIGEIRERPRSSMGHTLDKDPSLSPIRHTELLHIKGYSADDMSLEMKSSPSPHHRRRHHSPAAEREKRILPDVRSKETRDRQKDESATDIDWTKHQSGISSYSLPKGTTFYEDSTIQKPADREVIARTKMIEAKFHEEKLKLQQKHDAAVQKILDRKNAEIEDVKNQSKVKTKELEEMNAKLDRKVQTLMKEAEFIRQTKDKQISDLKKREEETNEMRKNDYEKRLHEVLAEFEQEKFELQKQHTQNIQDILDDTNDRLQRMETEYSSQATTTTNLIKELESRVQHLMTEVDSTLNQRSALEKEKNEAISKYERLVIEHDKMCERHTQLEHEFRNLKIKTEASLEYLKQEHSMSATKAADTIEGLEEKIDQLKKSLKDNEEHRQRQIREMEQNHQQDKMHLEFLHEKQVRNIKKEMEQLEADSNKKAQKLEQQIKEREEEVKKLKEQKQQQSLQAEQALEDFKAQVERNQARIYDEMKQQMQQVETDLLKSKQAREKQAKEFSRQIEEENHRHQHEMAELKVSAEGEKSQLMREFHMQKEFTLSEHEKDLEGLKEIHQAEMLALEARLKENKDRAEKTLYDNERQIRELREELVQANQLRKQQLVELGLLREEEKQKMHRDQEAELSRLRATMEQQKIELQRIHGSEMERVLEKTNERLKFLEKDSADRIKQSAEEIHQLQVTVTQLKGDLQRSQEMSDKMLVDIKHRTEEEKQNLRKQYSQNFTTIQRELEEQRNRTRHAEKLLQKKESDLEDKITQLKLQFEEKIRGLIPSDVKQELEDTIASLKSQVNSLQLRAAMLQEELDGHAKHGHFGPTSSSPIKSAG